ncbi:MAG: sugar transferase [Oscillospiraceae bacterium]|nr:sugar transferase [Oscillospiraceae bacterium]
MKKDLIMRGLKLLHSLFTVGLFCLCWYMFYRTTGDKPAYVRYNPLMVGAYIVIHICMYHIYQGYVVGYNRKTEIVFSQFLADLIACAIVWALDMLAWLKWINPLYFIGLVAAQLIHNIIWAIIANIVYFRVHLPKKTILIYRNKNDLARLAEAYRFPEKFTVERTLENPSSFEEIQKEVEGFGAVFVAGIPASLQNGLAKYCTENDIQGYFAPHIGDIIMMGAHHVRQFSIPILNVRRAKPAPEYLFMKRIFDIVVSGLAIIILSPVMLLVSIGVKACDGGPILYKQVRLTKDGKTFKIWKFRSMRVDAEKDGVARLSSGDKDNRITPIGKLIRACRLDELPQLFNIFGGSMTIVGPRPERPEIAAQYEELMPFSLRLQVKAGLTGYAQIYGKYNTNPYDKLQMDLLYINRMGVFEDIKLMFATVAILFKKESTEGVASGNVTAVRSSAENVDIPEEDKVNN